MAAKEGFWYSTSEPLLPMPIPNPEPNPVEFIDKYIQVQNDLRSRGLMKLFKGRSHCRLCGCINGCAEFRVPDKWHFPIGLLHYLQDHNVRPSKEFQQFIMDYTVGAS